MIHPLNNSLSAIKPFTSRADLHVHSRYSDRPSEWVLRRVGAPECFVEPLEVYDRAMAAGMDFVTISDHNKIAGALEIADKPNTFISSEITTYFPENGAKMHVLVTGITEEQFKVIQELRENIYAFRRYLVADDIIYSVAHPLFLVNEKLTIDQFERLLVMFNRFELINGTRDPRAMRVVAAVLDNLTAEDIHRMADKHDIEPAGPAPHLKMKTGGSDDHSGQYVASAFTVTPEATTVEEYLAHVRAGRHEPGGSSGSSIHLAHCFYHIAHAFYKDRLLADPNRGSLLGEVFKRMLGQAQPAPTGAGGMVPKFVRGWMTRRHVKKLTGSEQLIVTEFQRLFDGQQPAPSADEAPARGRAATRAFEASCRLAHELSFAFLKRLTEKFTSGDLMKSIEAIAATGPVIAAITPYLAAFKTQHKDEKFIQKVARHFDAAHALEARSDRKAWVTDTFDDVNGVTRTIRTLATLAHQRGAPMTVMTSVDNAPEVPFALENFPPVGTFDMPEYPEQKVPFPPFLQVLEYIERQQFSELVISTPGPMGLNALLAAKLLHLKTVGIYHTDFPNYIRTLTDDAGLEALGWRYMSWFFEQCDTILAPSDFYRRQLIEHGFAGSKIKVLRRGVDLGRFNPEHRVDGFWQRFGGEQPTTMLYVGRVSDEKNITLLTEAFDKLMKRGGAENVQLAIVGDGPRLASLKKTFRGNNRVMLTGTLTGDDLAQAYASSDVFVFPSTTDTFGNVVLEAMASGLPAIVSDRGGPQEIVNRHGAGVVCDLSTPSHAAEALAMQIKRFAADEAARVQLRERALETARSMSWDVVLGQLLTANQRDGSPTSGTMGATFPSLGQDRATGLTAH